MSFPRTHAINPRGRVLVIEITAACYNHDELFQLHNRLLHSIKDRGRGASSPSSSGALADWHPRNETRVVVIGNLAGRWSKINQVGNETN